MTINRFHGVGAVALSALALFVSSCQDRSGLSPVQDDITITAYADESTLTRTSLGNENDVIWSTSDKINLFYKRDSSYDMAEFSCISVSNQGRKATFSGSSQAEGASDYIALSPSDSEASCSSKGKVGTTMRSCQSATAGSFDSRTGQSIARGTDKDNLQFRNLVSLLGVSVRESGVNSVTIIGSSPMTGEFEVKADGTLLPGKMSRAVRIVGPMTSGNDYYASVIPGGHSKLRIVLGKEDGSFASFSGAAISLGRNEICELFSSAVSSWKQSKQLYINEVQCGPDDEKRIEIYNPNSADVSLWGWTILKDDRQMYAFSEGSSIAAHGYYVINCRKDTEDDHNATFGISGDGGFDLKLCHGPVIDELNNIGPVKVIVDGNTYGRRTDGSDEWVLFSSGTIGSDNSAGTVYVPGPTKTGVALNEISAPGGWVELLNKTADEVKLAGFKAYLNEEHKPVWTAALTDKVAANGYFAFNLTSLSARKNFTITIEDAAGDIVGSYTRGTKGEGWDELSLPENNTWSFSVVGGNWVYAVPTKNSANGAKTADIEMGSKLIMNELNGAASNGKDYVELYNPGVSTEYLNDFKVRRYRLKDGVDDDQTLWKGTSGVVLAPGAYLAIYYCGDIDDNNTYPLQLQRDFSAKKNTYIWLQDDGGNVIDTFQRGTKSSGWNNINMQKVENTSTGIYYSYSRVGTTWVYSNPTPGAVNGAKLYDIDQTMCPVVINEINMSGNWVELYNNGNTSVNLNGLQLRWSRVKSGVADNQTVWECTTSQILAPGAYYVITPGKVTLGSYSQKNIHIKLRSGSQTDVTGEKIEYDDFKRGKEGSNWTTVTLSKNITRSIVRVPDGRGDWYLGNATQATSNGTDKSGGLCPDVDQ